MVALETTELFCGLPPGEQEFLKNIADLKRFAAGQVIFREGDLGDCLYVIAEGRVQISVVLEPQKQQIISRFGPGDFFGEMAVLDNSPRSASAIAEVETQLWHIPRKGLLLLLERLPELAFGLMREFSQRLREFNHHYVREVLQAERLALVGRFARSIVHDFKNPLAIISLAADMGALEASPELRKLARDRVRKQVDRLNGMICELLEFTRGTQAAMVRVLADYSVFIAQLIEENQMALDEKSVTVSFDNPPPAVRLLLDCRRLNHAFANLIHNAIEAMPNGGKIVFRFSVRQKEVVTEIEDTGPGIDPQIAGSLFEPFATFAKSGGTGLGLSICQRIIHDHHGQIQARQEPGRGAIFSITLPLP
ncbi:MAG: cyclic nucleotide-binding domain-containing protein [Candidatus Omnitrophica bacterium]|nr:cyclic nucleotide-binding domain-containing protein [Candidatus Omnitrophota bacterium]